MEAGAGEVVGTRDIIPGGWELVWMQDPWTGKWELVRVPKQEAESRRKKGLLQRPSYWGETETREWQCKLREEKEAVEREREAKRAWHMEELQKMGCFLCPGTPNGLMNPRSGAVSYTHLTLPTKA